MKRILTIFCVVVFALCLLSDGLYLVLKFAVPQKMTAITNNVDKLYSKDEDGKTTEHGPVMELYYYANQDKSGVELLDFKLNYFKNEKSDSVFSSGLQVVNSDNPAITSYWSRYDSTANGLGTTWEYFKTTFNSPTYYYNTDGKNASYAASFPIEEDNYFLITIGDEQFRMMPRKTVNNDASKLEPYYFEEWHQDFLWMGSHIYKKLDWNYIVNIMLESLRSLEPGFDGTLTFKFGDLFDYYSYDEEKQIYTKIERTKNGSLIEEVITNYYNIRVKTFYRGATSASDSLFNIIQNEYNFNLTNSGQTNDYSIGKQIITLTQYDFDYIFVEGSKNSYKLKLKDNIKQYLSDKSNYLIKVVLQQNILSENFIKYDGLIYDEIVTENLISEVVLI